MTEITEDNLDALMHEESEDVFFEGVSSRFPEIMAAGMHSPGGPNGIIRSQSFAGFSALQERRSRCNSFIGNSATQKKLQSKTKKGHLSGNKSNSSSKESQPKRVEEVYGALKRGLDEYLEVHQTELDKLTSQLKDMKRNSRLGVLYDLDKQIKTIERYVRRLEFHISKVDELYEAFCIQRRLRDGASKMKQAFSSSPSTKGTRDSLAEINRRFKEYTENMCTFEGELENLLGEFHIKMRGLAGFARLCPGDQYEIFMRYGRQRWKLKGKIEVNARQSWDGEQMIFMPLITDLISIKVTELKGLATHILVGSVICETKDLFTAMPQVVAVDVNDLGTIKLNLEVTWFPFDVEDLTLSSGNLNKATALQRRVSVYSQGTPETPTFEDSSFFSALPDDIFENGLYGAERKRLSFTFNETANTSPTPLSGGLGLSNPEITVTPPENDRRSLHSVEEDRAGEAEAKGEEETSGSLASETETEWERAESLQNGLTSPSSAQFSGVGPENVFLDHGVSDTLLRDSDEASELKPVELDTDEGNLTKQLVKRLTSTEMLPSPDKSEGSLSWGSEGGRSFLDGSLEESIQGLLLKLETTGEHCKELQELDQEVMRLEDLLKCKPAAQRSRSSSLSLTVESALESFDFLNTSDFDDDDNGDDGLPRSVFFDMDTERTGPGHHPEARGHLSEALTEDTGVGNSVAGSPLPLTTGNESLDVAIVKHLQYCSHLVQQLLGSSGSPGQRRSVLQKLSGQTLLLEELGEISTERLGTISSAAEVLPGLVEKQSLLSLWVECSGPGSVFHTTLDRVVRQMHYCYGQALQERCPHGADAGTAIRFVVNEMAGKSEQASSPSSPFALFQDVVTIFQFHSYISTYSISHMDDHLFQVASEAVFLEALRSSSPQRVLQGLRGVNPSALRPQQETLKALASLLTADDSDLRQSAAAFLKTAANDPAFRQKAVCCYTEALSEAGVQVQTAACAALSCLQASDSIEAVVSLCDSADEELRHVAIETLLTFGEEGRLAYEQLDKVPGEMVCLGTRRGNAVTTAF
ncbi:rho family-interacting cell polarization regulator 2 isoform X1 [Amia ocellicauda]|uniref:rho family-interacting cell polarization regulator 2 isoform X1 n=1 Tax=Amia ocellicauda TaxID=2972642 RepID=UPI003463AB38